MVKGVTPNALVIQATAALGSLRSTRLGIEMQASIQAKFPTLQGRSDDITRHLSSLLHFPRVPPQDARSYTASLRTAFLGKEDDL